MLIADHIKTENVGFLLFTRPTSLGLGLPIPSERATPKPTQHVYNKPFSGFETIHNPQALRVALLFDGIETAKFREVKRQSVL